MKALSVQQPWAELIVSCKHPNVWATGCAVAVVNLVDCRPMTRADEEAALRDRWSGGKAWVLENPQRVKPVPVTGKKGVYDVDLDPGRLGIR